jgi:putative alpha-1,2-mannosidase
MFALWMFNFESDCARAQYWSRNVTNVHFTNTPHGVPGNEDYGSMASWLLFTSLGIFPQAGTTNFMIGSPRVKDASIRLTHLDGSTSVLNVVTNNNSAENVYVESLLVNGQPYASPVIDRSILAAPGGCKLEFTMTSTPKSGLCPSN